ncbi:unnamed protein product [Calypogeia fissa]
METCVAMAATGFASPTCLPSSSSSSSQRACANSPLSLSTSCGIVLRQHVRNGRRADWRQGARQWRAGPVVAMAPDDEKMTRRSPLDFPVEWDRPSPGRRPDVFPQFSPMKTPLPPPLPTDPPEEDEEEEEKKEDDPEKEDKPEE